MGGWGDGIRGGVGDKGKGIMGGEGRRTKAAVSTSSW